MLIARFLSMYKLRSCVQIKPVNLSCNLCLGKEESAPFPSSGTIVGYSKDPRSSALGNRLLVANYDSKGIEMYFPHIKRTFTLKLGEKHRRYVYLQHIQHI